MNIDSNQKNHEGSQPPQHCHFWRYQSRTAWWPHFECGVLEMKVEAAPTEWPGCDVATTFHVMWRHTWGRMNETLTFQRGLLGRAARLTRSHFLAFISHHWWLGTDCPTLPTPEDSQRVFSKFHLLTGGSSVQGNRITLINNPLLLKALILMYSGRASKHSRAGQWALVEVEDHRRRKQGLLQPCVYARSNAQWHL